MKNTLMLILSLAAVGIRSFAQFNTIDKYGTSKSPYQIFTQKMDTAVGQQLKIEQIKSEHKTTAQPKINSRLMLAPPLKSIKRNSAFGERIHPITMMQKFHSGIDLKAFYEPVYSIAAGIVIQAGTRPLEGNFLKIKHGEIESVYCHLSEISVAANEIVPAGKQIGVSGNTGRSTGPHLHFGLKYKGDFINPELYFDLIGLNNNTRKP